MSHKEDTIESLNAFFIKFSKLKRYQDYPPDSEDYKRLKTQYMSEKQEYRVRKAAWEARGAAKPKSKSSFNIKDSILILF